MQELAEAISLPIELYVRILTEVDYRTLLRCMEVSTLFRGLVLETAALQYIIELAAAGHHDEPRCNSSSASKLESLRKHQEAWRELKFSREYRIPMGDGHSWELCGGVLAQNMADGGFEFHRLPSDLRSVEEKRWVIPQESGFRVRDFGMDPSQDLLVLIEDPGWLHTTVTHYRIHLRAMSTGMVHPLATASTMVLKASSATVLGFTIQIFGDMVALFITPKQELAIWDWKTGFLLFNIYGRQIQTFSLMSDAWILLAVKGVIDQMEDTALQAINFRQEGNARRHLNKMNHSVLYAYPQTPESAYFDSMDIRADSAPSWARSASSSETPFSQDIEDFIFVISIGFSSDIGTQHTVQDTTAMHFISRNYLLSLSERVAPASLVLINWETWLEGSAGSRFFMTPDHPCDIWVCYVQGMKYAFSNPALNANSGLSVHLLDFNRMALERSFLDPKRREEALVDKASVRDFFGEELGTKLQCRSSHLQLTDAHVHCKVLCSEDNIILVDPECKYYRVLVF